MKHLITIIRTLLCISLLFSYTDNSKKPSGESTPDLHFISSIDNTVTYGFDSITALKKCTRKHRSSKRLSDTRQRQHGIPRVFRIS